MAYVLVIDDDETNRELMNEVLSLKGHQVLLAKDGFEGMRLFGENTPDLVITDIMMPQKDGLEVIGEIRQRVPHQKIIAMAAAGGIALDQALEAGADSTLEKPFRIQGLLQIVQTVLGTT